MDEPLSPADAVRLLSETARYEERLVQRTEGITVMVWGLVTPAIWMTYGYAERLGGLAAAWDSLLWLPWVLAGAAATTATWRSAALVQPALADRHGAGRWLRWAGLVAVLAVAFLFVRPVDSAGPLLVVGALWTAMGTMGAWRMSSQGRIVWIACGAALVVAGLVLVLVRPGEGVASLVSVAVTGLVPLAAGAWQTLRG